MELICPKCQGRMRQYERNGVTIDQCTECRGLFLDRGELERLVDAERGWHDQSQRHPDHRQQYDPRYEQRHEQPRYDDHRRYDDRHHSDYGRPKKRRSFLENLFDD
ncbi:TFIIB-type zinc ribbon-containing protein [Actinocatenispora rupis]|uniref:Transcription factor zinc-finger domain-containing protein n=1 Tax=Actinocatenispora rupis TaxID=519421 RepID=A0A8J3JB27_9ACTN|nr:zf-TFIIB domain-containing protein [Actinocatenispora rupis]GID13302.1 hypothetical protein Aru02nite_41910 [Actinocatenispora rupis]